MAADEPVITLVPAEHFGVCTGVTKHHRHAWRCPDPSCGHKQANCCACREPWPCAAEQRRRERG